jgi:endonuclease-8
MPEGPIIIILKEAVQQFKGEKVIQASGDGKFIDAALLAGLTITDFKSWGKHFLICFPEFTVQIHLMMFGSYRVNSHTAKQPRLHLEFEDGELNFYACQLHVIEQPLDEVYDWQADVMNPAWSAGKAITKMKRQPELLACDALMDQHLFAGVGNIIKNEVLFRTRIHPLSLVNELPTARLKTMMKEAVTYSLEFLKWKKANTLSKRWEAYNQKICPRDNVAFQKADTGKSHRSSYFCPLCQILYGEKSKTSNSGEN